MRKADWGFLAYGGCQRGGTRSQSASATAKKLKNAGCQRFWHDYYDAQRRYYRSLEHLDGSPITRHGQQIMAARGWLPARPFSSLR